jgi:tetratricopeptide (TPR) repeat protein
MLSAQPCLVRSKSQQPIEFESFAGKITPKLTPVEPSSRVAIAVFPSLIPAPQRDTVASELNALYKAAGKARLTLAVFNGEGFSAAGPFGTVTAWRNAVREALSGSAEIAPSITSSRLYSIVSAPTAAFGEDWSSVVFIGSFPELPPEERDYASAWLTPRFCAQKLRLSYWNPDGGQSPFWSSITNPTGGRPLSTLSDVLEPTAPGSWAESDWPSAPLDFGFLLYRGRLQSAQPEMAVLVSAPGVGLPDIDKFVEWQNIGRQLSELAKLKEPDASQAQQTRALVERALAIHARDAMALRAGGDYYTRARDYRSAAGYLEKLTKIDPHDPALQAELGHLRFAAGDLDGAEQALMQAHAGKAAGAAVPLELARIHLARKDDAGAIPFLEETLALDGRNTELWYVRADAAARSGDAAKAADSLEKALALDPPNLERRTALVRLYMQRGSNEDVLRHIRFVAAALPPDAATRRQYAEFLDALKHPEESLPVWKKVIEADPASEPAHYRVTRLLLDGGSVTESLAAAEAGLAAAPKSARLYLIKAEALERQDRYFEARRTLRNASQTVQDADLLGRLAEMEDISGRAAPQAYMAYFLARDKAAAHSPDPAEILKRALEVSVRDGDRKAVAFFESRLDTAGKPALSWLARSPEKNPSNSAVPGGFEALAFVLQMRVQSPQTFFAEYCRTLVDRLDIHDDKERNVLLEGIRSYFRQVGDLKALGKPGKNAVEITISAADKKSREQSERILGVLGWKLKTAKKGVTLEAGEKSAQARRQETASALAIDEVGIQEALEAGKAFRFEIPDEAAPVLLSESTWMTTFFPKTKFNGGFAEALATDLRVAKTYAALNVMGSRAVAALTAAADLKTLAEKHADVLFRYGSAFALQKEHAAVPGGAASEAVWEKLVGVAPAAAGKFFRALLEKDDGKLLAFFATLGQLDSQHQRFFTRSAVRTARFYELFKDSGEIAAGPERPARSVSFTEFLRETPLDADLHVLFPGGPEVWTLAKGNSSSVAQTGKLVKKLSRITAPEQEDEILDRLARTHYTVRNEKLSELDNFVAVVRIDRHRREPLDESSALLLAQNYVADKPVYPYFAALTDLAPPHFEHFFTLMERLSSTPGPELNVILGELHSLIELISLAQQSGALDSKSAAVLFDQVCAGFGKAISAAGYTEASLETLRELLRRSAPKQAGNPDRALESALLGEGGPVWFELAGAGREVDPFEARLSAYRKVLSEQKVTSLKTLLDFYGHLQDLAHARGSAMEHANALESLRGGLLTVDTPKKVKIEELDRKIVRAFDDAKVAERHRRDQRATDGADSPAGETGAERRGICLFSKPERSAGLTGPAIPAKTPIPPAPAQCEDAVCAVRDDVLQRGARKLFGRRLCRFPDHRG